MTLRTVLISALLLLAASATHAQEAEPAALCFRSAPGARCRVFLITELSRSTRAHGLGRDAVDQLQWEAGAMASIGERSAVGGTLVRNAPQNGGWGAAARYRRWLDSNVSVDVSPGVLIVGDSYNGRRLRLTGSVSLNARGWLGVVTHGESGRDGGRGGIGVKLGEWPGLIGGAALYALLSAVPAT